jgi:tetratricopeptide (TPR) repeat protein
VHRICKTLTGIMLVAGVGTMALLPARPAYAQAAAQKKVKDQVEWDLFDKVTKASDPNEKIKLLNTWKEKYPGTDFKEERLQHFIQAYAQIGKFAEVIDSSKELLGLDPKNVTALYWIAFLTPVVHPTNPSPEALGDAEKAANGLLAAEMPPNTKADDWTKAKQNLDGLAHKALGWVAWQRKDYATAEQEFTKSLELVPNQGEVSYWMGTVQLASQNPEKQAPALFHIARAVSLDPKAGGLPDPNVRKQIGDYLTRNYTAYHGSEEGLAELRTLAQTHALPPEGFTVKSAAEIAVEKEEELRRTNPALALWLNLKKELSGPTGEEFFASTMKNAQVPGGAGGVEKLKGHVLIANPATRSKELVVAVADPNIAEVTLRLETPLTGKPVIGSELSFEGVPVEFTKEPFMVTFEQAKVSDVTLEAPPARKTARKKK